ncbi:MAG: uracil-DNA glycosylase [Elusimicrobiota bacterium]
MSKENLIKEYLKKRKETGETGFWIDPGKNKVSSPSRLEILEDMKEEVKKCKKCPLGTQRLNACFGGGSPSADLMFVGEGPGFNEDHQGKVFVGRAGKLLTKIINNVFKLKREEVYITNIVKCHPMKDPDNPEKHRNDRPPTTEEVKSCIPYLVKQIELIKPKVLVPLGSPASKTILDTSTGITKLRGQVYDIDLEGVPVKVVPTYHPAYLLRSPSKKKETFEDTKIIRQLI